MDPPTADGAAIRRLDRDGTVFYESIDKNRFCELVHERIFVRDLPILIANGAADLAIFDRMRRKAWEGASRPPALTPKDREVLRFAAYEAEVAARAMRCVAEGVDHPQLLAEAARWLAITLRAVNEVSQSTEATVPGNGFGVTG